MVLIGSLKVALSPWFDRISCFVSLIEDCLRFFVFLVIFDVFVLLSIVFIWFESASWVFCFSEDIPVFSCLTALLVLCKGLLLGFFESNERCDLLMELERIGFIGRVYCQIAVVLGCLRKA